MNPDTAGDADSAHCVLQARRGSAAACERLYRRYLPWVHGLLLARHRPAIADELTQECFALAFRRLDQLREPAHFGAWIGRIARRLRDDTPLRDVALDDDTAQALADPASGPEQHAEAQHMLAAIRALPEAYRETLVLRLVEGMDGAEIARLTGLTPESVRVNLHRGLQKLRARVAAPQKERSDA